MRLSTAALGVLIIGAIAKPMSPSEAAKDVLNKLERRDAPCACFPNCGCPNGSSCFCQGCVPPVRANCYPNCGCDNTSGVCIVRKSLRSILPSCVGSNMGIPLSELILPIASSPLCCERPWTDAAMVEGF
ncbi:hypothetical protein F4780DRAFT_756480 [Xylariomycetidae sp. FL0641]|nr:hypothetical protein F4780DRAFT_756480 [Xylariomycetidae sp. FL0641]